MTSAKGGCSLAKGGKSSGFGAKVRKSLLKKKKKKGGRRKRIEKGARRPKRRKSKVPARGISGKRKGARLRKQRIARVQKKIEWGRCGEVPPRPQRRRHGLGIKRSPELGHKKSKKQRSGNNTWKRKWSSFDPRGKWGAVKRKHWDFLLVSCGKRINHLVAGEPTSRARYSRPGKLTYARDF